MMENQILSEINEKLKTKVIIVEKPQQFSIESVFNGVLLMNASWSGSSVSRLKAVLQILNTSTRTDFEIIIFDVDKLSIEQQKTCLGFYSHGYLEGVLINKGIVLLRNKHGKDVESFNVFKEKLIEFV